jgi:hypothetical protein
MLCTVEAVSGSCDQVILDIQHCKAYTREHTNKIACDYYGSPRFFIQKDIKGRSKPQKQYLYEPLTPRLRRQYMMDQARTLMEYRVSFDDQPGDSELKDFFNGKLYQEWLRKELGFFQR